MNAVPPGTDCARCGHPFDDHLLFANGDPLTGGTMTCPVKGCDCLGTWEVRQR